MTIRGYKRTVNSLIDEFKVNSSALVIPDCLHSKQSNSNLKCNFFLSTGSGIFYIQDGYTAITQALQHHSYAPHESGKVG
jgi:hypothetical protein